MTVDLFLGIINYIEENLTEEITLDGLSERFFISKFYLARSFSNLFGHSLFEYIRKRKIARAALEVLSGRYRISFIANKYGFSAEAFSRAFKKETGKVPSRFEPHDTMKLLPKFDDGLLFGLRSGVLSTYPKSVVLPETYLLGVSVWNDITQKDHSDGVPFGLDFFTTAHLISGAIEPGVYYGVVSNFSDTGNDYMPSIRVAKEAALPEGMKKITLPAGEYNVLTYTGFHSITALSPSLLGPIWNLIGKTFKQLPFYFERINNEFCSEEYVEIDFYCPAPADATNAH